MVKPMTSEEVTHRLWQEWASSFFGEDMICCEADRDIVELRHCYPSDQELILEGKWGYDQWPWPREETEEEYVAAGLVICWRGDLLRKQQQMAA